MCVISAIFFLRSVKTQDEKMKAKAMYEETQKCSNTSLWSDHVSYKHLRAHETLIGNVCRHLLAKKHKFHSASIKQNNRIQCILGTNK